MHGVMEDADDRESVRIDPAIDMMAAETPNPQGLLEAHRNWPELRIFDQSFELFAQSRQIDLGAFDAVFAQAVSVDSLKVGKRLCLDVKPHVRHGPWR